MNLSKAQKMLDAYLEAEIAVLAGQSITKMGRTWTRANLAEIQKGRAYWEQKVSKIQSPARHRPAIAEFS